MMTKDKPNRAIPKPGDVVVDLPCLNIKPVRKGNVVISKPSK